MLQPVGTAVRGSEQLQVCEVCRLCDGDLSAKPCRWCDMCQAWICRHDWKNVGRRALAAVRRRMGM